MQFHRWLLGLSGIGAVALFMSACGEAPSCGEACRTCEATCCDDFNPVIPGRLAADPCLDDAQAECESHGGLFNVSFDDVEIPVNETLCCQELECKPCAAACCDGQLPLINGAPSINTCAIKINSACLDHGGVFQGYFDHMPTMNNHASCAPPACMTACCDGTVQTNGATDANSCIFSGGLMCANNPSEAFLNGKRVFRSQTSSSCPSSASCKVTCDGTIILESPTWDCGLCKNISHAPCPAPMVTTITFDDSATCAPAPPP